MAQPVIKVAHDYICPWCWIALKQVNDLKAEFDIEFDWVGYELMPENLPWGEPGPAIEKDPRRPVTPTRMELAYAASGMTPPTAVRPKQMRSHNALQAAEFAKDAGVFDVWNEKVYRALWEEGLEINSLEVLESLAEGVFDDPKSLITAVSEKRFSSRIVPFDDEAYAAGVFNVPTYYIGDAKYAEQPTAVLRKALRELLSA